MFFAILELAKIYAKKTTPDEGHCAVEVIDYNGNRGWGFLGVFVHKCFLEAMELIFVVKG